MPNKYNNILNGVEVIWDGFLIQSNERCNSDVFLAIRDQGNDQLAIGHAEKYLNSTSSAIKHT